MTLLDIRQMLVKLSGRYDLIKDVDTYADAGANFLIRAGQRKLDSMFVHSYSYGYKLISTTIGRDTYPIPNMISVDKVLDSGGVIVTHLEGDISSSDIGWVFATQVRAEGSGRADFVNIHIQLIPVPSTEVEYSVYGRVVQPLLDDASENFWTLNYPETLLTAALWVAERFKRNTRGMNDYMASIVADLRELEYNEIESEIGSLNQMNDSW